jgi:zinc protease
MQNVFLLANPNFKTFKHETLRQFYKDWYRPNLQAVIVVGDIDVDQMEQKIKQHFSGIQNPVNERKREIFDLPDNKEPLVSIETDEEATSNTVMFFYKHPKNTSKPSKILNSNSCKIYSPA